MYPNPKRDVNLCGRQGRKSNICDPDRILSERAANRIEGIIKEIADGVKPYKKSSCGSKGLQGVQVLPLGMLLGVPYRARVVSLLSKSRGSYLTQVGNTSRRLRWL